MNTEKTISELKKHAGIFEIYQKFTFEGYRENQKLEITILDAGPDVNPGIRYHCKVESDNGKIATGNSAATIDRVLSNVHWNELDG